MTWTLAPVDSEEVTILVDNVSDALLAPAPVAMRPRLSLEGDRDQLLAEHGYSLLVTVETALTWASWRATAGCAASPASSDPFHHSGPEPPEASDIRQHLLTSARSRVCGID